MYSHSDRKISNDLKSVFSSLLTAPSSWDNKRASAVGHSTNLASHYYSLKTSVFCLHARKSQLLTTVENFASVESTVNWMPEKFSIRGLFVSRNGNQMFCMKKFNFPISFQVFPPSVCGLKNLCHQILVWRTEVRENQVRNKVLDL